MRYTARNCQVGNGETETLDFGEFQSARARHLSFVVRLRRGCLIDAKRQKTKKPKKPEKLSLALRLATASNSFPACLCAHCEWRVCFGRIRCGKRDASPNKEEKKRKKNASAGNRTRVTCMASKYHTTRTRTLHIIRNSFGLFVSFNKLNNF